MMLITAEGSIPQIRAAVAMGLTLFAIASTTLACAKVDEGTGDGGADGATTAGSCDDTPECGACQDCSIAGNCHDANVACLGSAGDCSDGVPECCDALNCLSACWYHPVSYWACMCGSADRAGCDFANAPAGTCVGEYPMGVELLYGPQGYVNCLEDQCPSSCGTLEP